MIFQVVTIANNKKESLSAPEESDRMLISRVGDCVRFVNEKHCKKFVGFLDEHQLAVAKKLGAEGHCTVYEYGGYSGAERMFLGFYPGDERYDDADFPIMPITLTSRKGAGLAHRDYLGSLMGLGIERYCIGDILSEDGRCVVFLKNSIAEYVMESLSKVGSEGVKCCTGYEYPLPVPYRFKEIRDTVASARLDSVVAALCDLSRTCACEKIRSGLVSIDGLMCCKATKSIAPGTKITVRGFGKYAVDEISTLTRKNRIIIEARKYI